MKFLLPLFFLFSFAATHAATKTVCFDETNTKGSYSIDITGYRELMNDTTTTMYTKLFFKKYGAAPELIHDMFCFRMSTPDFSCVSDNDTHIEVDINVKDLAHPVATKFFEHDEAWRWTTLQKSTECKTFESRF